MTGWLSTYLADVPQVTDGQPGDPVWHAVQHALCITAFGVNAFVATTAGQQLVAPHDETSSGQEELYVVLDGTVSFQLDDTARQGDRGMLVAVTAPMVVRSATAVTARAALLAIGVRPGCFATTWRASHFADVDRLNGE